MTTRNMEHHHSNDSPPESGRSQPGWYRWLTVLIGIVIGGGFLFLAIRRVDMAEVQQVLRGANLRWLLPLILVLVGSFWVRGLRWAAMFPPRQHPSAFRTFNAFLIGLLINSVLPGRLGEVLRIGVIKRHIPMVSLSSILATVVLERVFDGLVLVCLLALVLVVAPLPAWVGQMGIVGGALFLGLLIILFLLTRNGTTSAPWLMGRSSDGAGGGGTIKVLRIVQSLLRQFSHGLSALSKWRTFVLVSVQSLLIWGGEIVVMDLMFRVFDLSLPFSAATVTLVILSLGLMIPSAPGFIGSYQFFIMSSLYLYNVSESHALAIGILLNLVVFILSTFLGILALLFEWPFVWTRHPKTHSGYSEECNQEERR